MGAKGKANPANLRMWPKGVSGNPAGRPKTKIIREIVRQIIEEKDPKTKKLIARKFAEVLIDRALKGSITHWQQALQLIESDTPGAGWSGDGKLDADAVAKLISKICR
jgi:ribosomal protein L17